MGFLFIFYTGLSCVNTIDMSEEILDKEVEEYESCCGSP